MATIAMTAYVLIWPIIVMVVLVVIARAFIAEWRAARRKGEDLI